MKANPKSTAVKVSGYAFVELLIILAILAILLAIALPIGSAIREDAKQKAIEREQAENTTKTP